MRNYYISSSITAVALFASASTASAGTPVAATTTYTQQSPEYAVDFINSLGVNTHMTFVGESYTNNGPVVAQQLAYLGISHVRDSYETNAAFVATCLAPLISQGVRVDMIVKTTTIPATVLDIENNAPFVEAIEGRNEVDNLPVSFNGLTGIAGANAYQQALYTAVHSDPVLNGSTQQTPVLGYSLANPALNATYGTPNSAMSFQNVHAYAGNGNQPLSAIQLYIADTIYGPGLPTVITETGYPTLPYNPLIPAGQNAVTEDVQSRYLLNAVFDGFKIGAAKTYIYELEDNENDPNNTSTQYHFGLFRYAGTAKPSATTLHNLTTILNDPAGQMFISAPNPLTFTLQQTTTVANQDINQFSALLQKKNGNYELVLWGEPRLSNPLFALPAWTPNAVTVTMPRTFAAVRVFDPLVGTTPIASYTNTALIHVSVTDHPVIVEFAAQ